MKTTCRRAIFVFMAVLFFADSLAAEGFMSWENFPAINLPNITTQDGISTGNSSATLLLNGDAQISADNTSAAQLTLGSCTLKIEYQLTFDGNGDGATGGPGSGPYATYDQFLSTPAVVTHFDADDDVEVTLHVRALNFPGQLADRGAYAATQTLTAQWVGP